MSHLYNNSTTKEKRRLLRKNQTDTEKVLWHYLRAKQLAGFKFQRQYAVGIYIIDFYCPKVRLGIELDGGQHNETRNIYNDKQRTKFLSDQNITIIRFWNNEVLVKTDSVLEVILNNLQLLTHPNPPLS